MEPEGSLPHSQEPVICPYHYHTKPRNILEERRSQVTSASSHNLPSSLFNIPTLDAI
jgi:hypothetical protein